MQILLLGAPGTGKSAVGSWLANVPHLEPDAYRPTIERCLRRREACSRKPAAVTLVGEVGGLCPQLVPSVVVAYRTVLLLYSRCSTASLKALLPLYRAVSAFNPDAEILLLSTSLPCVALSVRDPPVTDRMAYSFAGVLGVDHLSVHGAVGGPEWKEAVAGCFQHLLSLSSASALGSAVSSPTASIPSTMSLDAAPSQVSATQQAEGGKRHGIFSFRHSVDHHLRSRGLRLFNSGNGKGQEAEKGKKPQSRSLQPPPRVSSIGKCRTAVKVHRGGDVKLSSLLSLGFGRKEEEEGFIAEVVRSLAAVHSPARHTLMDNLNVVPESDVAVGLGVQEASPTSTYSALHDTTVEFKEPIKQAAEAAGHPELKQLHPLSAQEKIDGLLAELQDFDACLRL